MKKLTLGQADKAIQNPSFAFIEVLLRNFSTYTWEIFLILASESISKYLKIIQKMLIL